MQLNADPFDMDAQRRIEEEIRLQNVSENMDHAMEHNPGRPHHSCFHRVLFALLSSLRHFTA